MTLSYPLNLNEFDNDFVTFQHRPYRTNSEYGYQGSAPQQAGSEAIKLYMPNSTPAASQGNKWDQQNFSGNIGEAVQRIAGDGMDALGELKEGNFKQAGEDLGRGISSNIAAVINEGGALAYEAAVKAAGNNQIFGGGNNILSFTTGRIFNPNVELLYQGPQLRDFRFDFVFVPKNATESSVVDKIIKTFKEYSSPDDSEKGYLQVPHVWDIVYGGIGGKKLNKFKPCALQNITVRDNPQSETHTTFVDGTPVATAMSLSFQEMDMVFRKDHSEGVRGF